MKRILQPELMEGEVQALAYARADFADSNSNFVRHFTELMSLLNLNVIGIHSNFFELGGHSLLATQVVAPIQRVLVVDLPLRRLFETPTVAELALAIVEKQAEQVGGTALNKMLAELEEANPRLEDSAEQTS